MKLLINHKTQYTYDAPLVYGLQQVRLTPVNTAHQRVLNWSIQIEGGIKELQFVDHYQNQTILVMADPDATRIELTVSGEIETQTSDGIFGKVYGATPLWHFLQATPRTAPGAGIEKLSKVITHTGNTIAELHALCQKILSIVPYGHADTDASTTAEEALTAGGGVCQDHAQIFIAAVRQANIPARYVSGYLFLNGQIDQDASHAWAEAHIDGLGWVGFDVSNGISPDDRYVRIAVGRDSKDAAPVTGMRMGSAAEDMNVSLQIQQ